jgi:hypothetical protein
LLVSLHPRCACSQATLTELARLMARAPGPLRVDVLVYAPAGGAPSWTETDLIRRARSISGVSVNLDPGGVDSGRLGISTSGHALLIAPDGRTLFSGGITYARGHEGDNAGSAAILSLLARNRPALVETPVFGCSIRERT